MLNLTILPSFRCDSPLTQRLQSGTFLLALVLGWAGIAPQRVMASHGPQHPPALLSQTSAPAELLTLLRQIDAAASRENLEGVLQFYSPNFRHADGLTRRSWGQALTAFWKQYDQLKYQTKIQSWQRQGNGWVAETVTQITGTQKQPNRTLQLNATLTARQRIVGREIVSQNILAEKTQITAGTNPPDVEFNLPQQVNAGGTYSFDAIVKEPLGSSMLLGAALEEPVTARSYLQASPVKLEVLPAGGLFKVGQAPQQAVDQWISAVLIRSDGMTMVSQRLKVTNRTPTASQK